MKQSELVNRTIFFLSFFQKKKLGTTQQKSSCTNVHINDQKTFFVFCFWHFLSNNTALFKQIIKTNIYLNVQAS